MGYETRYNQDMMGISNAALPRDVVKMVRSLRLQFITLGELCFWWPFFSIGYCFRVYIKTLQPSAVQFKEVVADFNQLIWFILCIREEGLRPKCQMSQML